MIVEIHLNYGSGTMYSIFTNAFAEYRLLMDALDNLEFIDSNNNRSSCIFQLNATTVTLKTLMAGCYACPRVMSSTLTSGWRIWYTLLGIRREL